MENDNALYIKDRWTDPSYQVRLTSQVSPNPNISTYVAYIFRVESVIRLILPALKW